MPHAAKHISCLDIITNPFVLIGVLFVMVGVVNTYNELQEWSALHDRWVEEASDHYSLWMGAFPKVVELEEELKNQVVRGNHYESQWRQCVSPPPQNPR